MVQLVCGMATLPTPDDAADALAVAICIANRVGPVTQERARRCWTGRPSRRSSAASRAYERAVREAIAREKPANGAAPDRPAAR